MFIFHVQQSSARTFAYRHNWRWLMPNLNTRDATDHWKSSMYNSYIYSKDDVRSPFVKFSLVAVNYVLWNCEEQACEQATGDWGVEDFFLQSFNFLRAGVSFF
jgi:hypothetical protein